MKAFLLLIVGLLSSGCLWAFDTCKSDYGGTFKSDQLELQRHKSVACAGCREVLHHPEDIQNFMYNWAVLGRGGTLTPGTSSLGSYIFEFRLDEPITAEPLDGALGTNTMAVPVCNDHGQCATGMVEVEHNAWQILNVLGWRVSYNINISWIHVSVALPNGRVRTDSYSRAQRNANLQQSGFKLPVPADPEKDFAKDDTCLNNRGQLRPPDSQMVPTNPSGSSADYDDPYERWWDEEEAYGGRVPEHRCGLVSISGGGSTLTCGWFWY